MSIFNIVICDDDTDFLDVMHMKISNIMSNSKCEYKTVELYDGIELLEYCKKNIVDIVLVDIDMPNMTGFEAIQKIQKQCPDLAVIFVTAHEEYAFQAYSYQPFWFVSKRRIDDLDEVMNKLIKKLKCRRSSNEIFHLKLDKIYSINVNEIIYFENDKHYIWSYYINGKVANYRCSIKEAYSQLVNAGYIYIHRSYIINCRYIEQFDTKNVLLTNKKKIKVTRNTDMLREAQKIYGKFMRELRW